MFSSLEGKPARRSCRLLFMVEYGDIFIKVSRMNNDSMREARRSVSTEGNILVLLCHAALRGDNPAARGCGRGM